LVLGSSKLNNTAPAASKSNAWFKSGQKKISNSLCLSNSVTHSVALKGLKCS